MIEALMRFDHRRASSRRVECACSEEVRARFPAVRERQAATDRSRRRTLGSRCDRLRADRVPVGFTPLRLVVAQPSTKLGQLRPPRHAVFGFPAVRGDELLLGESRDHADIVESTLMNGLRRFR